MTLKKTRTERHVISLCLLLSLYFAWVINLPILLKIYGILKLSGPIDLLFLASVPLVIFCAVNVLLLVFSIRYVVKPLFIALIVISVLVSYASYFYGVIFNVEMIENIFQTHYGESQAFLNKSLVLWFLGMSLLPVIWLIRTKIYYPSIIKETFQKLLAIIISLSILLAAVTFYYKDYSSLVRNHAEVKRSLIPYEWMFGLVKYIKTTHFDKKPVYTYIGLDAKHIASTKNDKKNLLVLVVGETARRQNFAYDGYSKPTNVYTSQQQLTGFKHVTSCGTATAVSLPCMFSNMERKGFSIHPANNQDNALDVLKRAGIYVAWLDNDGGCKGVCKHVDTLNLPVRSSQWCDGASCYDEALVQELASRIDTLHQQDNVMVLHLIGSHGPNYYQRYPKDKAFFKPDCQRSDIQSCSNEELINTYDNTIRYTDFVLARLVRLLKKHHQEFNTALIYISDHGESFGERGMYLHGSPYFIAPSQQTEIPLMLWFSKSFQSNKAIDAQCITHQAENGSFSHDNLFHSLLGLMDVKTKVYASDKDIFYPCRKSNLSYN